MSDRGRIEFRVRDGEKAYYETAAAMSGRTLSDWIRRVVMIEADRVLQPKKEASK